MGRDLLTVEVEGRKTPLYALLATRLAASLGLSTADLPEGDELQEVAKRHLEASGEPHTIYRKLRIILNDFGDVAIPESLSRLVEIPSFKLFLTTTFDVLLERAINQERFEGQRQTLVFANAPNDKQDLPREFNRVNRPTVFHLLGRFSATPLSYAVTQRDAVDFLGALQSRTEDSPSLLFDTLKNSNLLVLGCRSFFNDWLTQFFIGSTRAGGHIDVPIDWVPHRRADPSGGRVVFLRHFAGGAKIFRGPGAEDFVEELHRRWSELESMEQPTPPASLSEKSALTPGAVYLSYAGPDAETALSIRDALDEAGVDVIFDDDSSEIGAKWETKLRSTISECCLFVPIFSNSSSSRSRRFFRDEWMDAILESSKVTPTGQFVLPLLVDATTPESVAFPESWGEPDWTRLSGGEVSPRFVEMVVQLQRSYRSASFA